MKTSSSCIGWKTGVFSLIVLTLLFIGAIGCQSDAASDATLEPQGVEYPIPENAEFMIDNLILLPDDNLLTKRLSKHGDAVTFSTTAMVLYLPKDIKNYTQYKQLLDEATQIYMQDIKKHNDPGRHTIPGKLKFIIGDEQQGKQGHPIVHIERPSPEEIQSQLERYGSFKSHDLEKTVQRRSLQYKMSLSKAKEFFSEFKNLSCNRVLRNPCLPFQYATDGCYARAHYMRKVMAEAGYDCKKIFAIDQGGRLQANTKANCCVSWGYHVAPLLHVEDGYSTKMMVIDPSLFDEPVVYTTWVNKMKANCKRLGMPNIRTEIKSSEYFAYIHSSGAFTVDDDYSLTFYILDEYSLKYGCN